MLESRALISSSLSRRTLVNFRYWRLSSRRTARASHLLIIRLVQQLAISCGWPWRTRPQSWALLRQPDSQKPARLVLGGSVFCQGQAHFTSFSPETSKMNSQPERGTYTSPYRDVIRAKIVLRAAQGLS